MNLNKPIAFGRRSQIFSLDNKTIIKLYDKDLPKDKITQEFEKTQTIYNSKLLNIPKPIRVITKGKRTGIVFEKIDGVSYMDLFMKKPWLFLAYTPIIAQVHKNVHRVFVKNLPHQEEEFTPIIKSSDRLTSDDKNQLLKVLNKKYTPTLCHGDFHHGNLVEDKNGKVYILDWMDAFLGDYRLDVALTAVNAMVSDAPEHIPTFYRNAYEILKKLLKLDNRYLKYYGLAESDIKVQLFLAAGIHLARCNRADDSLHKSYFEHIKQQIIIN